MKIFNLMLINFCLISYINSTCQPDEENNKIRKDKDCINRVFSDEEKSRNAYKCCKMRAEVDSNNFKGKEYSCISLTENDYKNVKQLIKNLELDNTVKDVSIDCKSSYLKFGFLILLLLLF